MYYSLYTLRSVFTFWEKKLWGGTDSPGPSPFYDTEETSLKWIPLLKQGLQNHDPIGRYIPDRYCMKVPPPLPGMNIYQSLNNCQKNYYA